MRIKIPLLTLVGMLLTFFSVESNARFSRGLMDSPDFFPVSEMGPLDDAKVEAVIAKCKSLPTLLERKRYLHALALSQNDKAAGFLIDQLNDAIKKHEPEERISGVFNSIGLLAGHSEKAFQFLKESANALLVWDPNRPDESVLTSEDDLPEHLAKKALKALGASGKKEAFDFLVDYEKKVPDASRRAVKYSLVEGIFLYHQSSRMPQKEFYMLLFDPHRRFQEYVNWRERDGAPWAKSALP